jgi:hypothetical protein
MAIALFEEGERVVYEQCYGGGGVFFSARRAGREGKVHIWQLPDGRRRAL